jgi:hypothetical protein
MKQDNSKLSFCGKFAHRIFFTKPSMGYQAEQFLSLAMFVLAILWLHSAIQSGEIKKFIYSSAFGLFSIIWFVKSGCSELSKKKYINQNSNQQVEPIVTTPVDEVEAQSTQAHP